MLIIFPKLAISLILFLIMKEVLETIPVWDALKEDTECPICSLMKKGEEDALKYYLGPAVMVPEIRVEINKKGYCNKHWQMLSDLNKAQPLALSLDTYYEESKKVYKEKFAQIGKSNNARKALKLFSAFEEEVGKREEGCLVCDYMKKRLDRYTATFAVLFKEDRDFKDSLSKSKGFCIHHTLDLVHSAKAELSGSELLEYLQLLAKLLDDNLDRVQKDVWWMTQKYKSENKDKPWNGCEDAFKRGVDKLTGKGILS